MLFMIQMPSGIQKRLVRGRFTAEEGDELKEEGKRICVLLLAKRGFRGQPKIV
jgi:hypothetical protein